MVRDDSIIINTPYNLGFFGPKSYKACFGDETDSNFAVRNGHIPDRLFTVSRYTERGGEGHSIWGFVAAVSNGRFVERISDVGHRDMTRVVFAGVEGYKRGEHSSFYGMAILS